MLFDTSSSIVQSQVKVVPVLLTIFVCKMTSSCSDAETDVEKRKCDHKYFYYYVLLL